MKTSDTLLAQYDALEQIRIQLWNMREQVHPLLRDSVEDATESLMEAENNLTQQIGQAIVRERVNA